jgi:NitT/TauT family transport system substrate-binding protein
LLRSDGVSLDRVRIVPAGQSWVEQSSLLITGTADAVMGDEPFASRLAAEGQVFFLAHLGDPATAQRIPGADFLHAALEARRETIDSEPQKVDKMVRMLKRALQWIARHSAEELVDALNIADAEERAALLRALKQYPRAFSKDGGFSTRQLKATEQFFHATNADNPPARAVRVETMIDDRWAGRGK